MTKNGQIWKMVKRFLPILGILICLLVFLQAQGQNQARRSFETLDKTITRHKCSPRIQESLSQITDNPRSTKNVMVLVRDPGLFISGLRSSGYILPNFLVNKTYNLITIDDCPLALLEAILHSDQTLFLDLNSKTAYEEIIIKDFDPGLNRIDLAQNFFPFLTGAGLNVSVKENLFNPGDIDIQSQIIGPLRDDQISTHTTTVATIIVGRGNTAKESRGLAPEAGLSSSSFLKLVPDEMSYFSNHRIFVQNHSYGIDLENYYGIEAMAYDLFMEEHPEILHVFSAGNSGLSAPVSGSYQGMEGWSNLTGNMKMAKNVLVVGAVDSFGVSSELASRGPAYDGRIKPELVTMGQRGSSESAAVASGAALLLQQAYASLNDGRLPPASLLKVILINSADDAGPAGIDFITGYGSLNLFEAIYTVLEGRYMEGIAHRGEISSFEIEVPENVRQLKITLGWNDMAAEVNAGKALVNDLDLTLEKDDQIWLPWTLNIMPDVNMLVQPAERQEDHLNNIEQITVAAPAAGKYRISVAPYTLINNAQSFSISYQLDTLDTFYWVNPSPDERLPANAEVVLRWNQNFEDDFGRLEYSRDGDRWDLIDSFIDIQANYLKWITPSIFSELQLKMTIENKTFLSDKFIISDKTELAVGFECDAEFLLNWTPVKGAVTYDLFQFDGKDMSYFLSQTDTQLILNKSEFKSDYFAVMPVSDLGLKGYRSNAINYPDQGSFCYLESFFSRLEADFSVLELNLSSIFQVTKIRLEKDYNGDFRTILETSDAAHYLQFRDMDLWQGLNSYRAVVTLENGLEITSEITGVFYAGENSVLLFPNPVNRDAEITVLLKNPGVAEIFIYDFSGKSLRKFNVLLGNTNIPLEGLLPGIYFYQIQQQGEITGSGSFQVI